jgi:hypothetical protein
MTAKSNRPVTSSSVCHFLSAEKNEMLGLLFVVPVLFQKKEVVSRAKALRGGVRNPETIPRQHIELEAYLCAEALDVSFDKVPST